MTADHEHERCDRLRMLLFDVGLDASRVECWDDMVCVVHCGTGNEGLPLATVERLTDKAIALAGWHGTP